MSKRITPEELPRVLQTLRDGAARAQCDALRRLCPCRSRCYEPQVWLSILHMWANTHDEQVRHQAQHAIDTLQNRTRTDPRSQELVRKLAPFDPRARELSRRIPTYREPMTDAQSTLVVPNWERTPRSRRNRRR